MDLLSAKTIDITKERFRAAFIGDPHFDSQAPHSRKDDYPETMKAKLIQLRDWAKKEVDAVFFLGDFLHRKAISQIYLIELIHILRSFDPVPCFTIVGNHDVAFEKVEYLNRSPLALLIASGALIRFDEVRVVSEQGGSPYLVIKGYDYTACPEISAWDLSELGKKAQVKIACAHAYMGDAQNFGSPEATLSVEQILKSRYDWVFGGHDHVENCFTAKEGERECRVIVPGALSRGTKHVYNRTRQVAFYELRMGSQMGVSIQRYALGVLPPEKIFAEEQLNREDFTAKLSKLILMLDGAVQGGSGDKLYEIFDSMGLDQGVKYIMESYLKQGGFLRSVA